MHSYCTSSVLSRRDFLKLLLALSGLPALLSTLPRGSSLAKQAKDVDWQEPVWLWDLASEKTRGPHTHPTNSAALPYGMPGSVMKLVTTTALLEDRLITPNQSFLCGGSIRLHGQNYHCPHAHGTLTLLEAIGVSCNVFFAQAVNHLSHHRFLEHAQRFQLHHPLHAGNPFRFEMKGIETQPIQHLALGLSTNIQPNALQLLRLAQCIAQQDLPNITPGTWDILQQGMRLATRHGTAQGIDPTDHFKLAAKTGTVPHGQRFNSWLIGYFPFEQPRFAFCTRAAEGTAKDSAVPILRHFLSQKEWL